MQSICLLWCQGCQKVQPLFYKTYLSQRYMVTSALNYETLVLCQSTTNKSTTRNLQQKVYNTVNHVASFSTTRLLQRKLQPRYKPPKEYYIKNGLIPSDERLNEVVNYDLYLKFYQNLLNELRKEYAEQLTITEGGGLLDRIKVQCDNGGVMRLPQIAHITLQDVYCVRYFEKRFIIDFKDNFKYIRAAKKAIHESGMSLDPIQEGTALHCLIPDRIHHIGTLVNPLKQVNVNNLPTKRRLYNMLLIPPEGQRVSWMERKRLCGFAGALRRAKCTEFHQKRNKVVGSCKIYCEQHELPEHFHRGARLKMFAVHLEFCKDAEQIMLEKQRELMPGCY